MEKKQLNIENLKQKIDHKYDNYLKDSIAIYLEELNKIIEDNINTDNFFVFLKKSYKEIVEIRDFVIRYMNLKVDLENIPINEKHIQYMNHVLLQIQNYIIKFEDYSQYNLRMKEFILKNSEIAENFKLLKQNLNKFYEIVKKIRSLYHNQ